MACDICPLNNTSPKIKDIGSRKSGVMFVGEAPNTNEIEVGQPFVGRSGQLLNKLIEYIGLSRDAVVIANAIKCKIEKHTSKTILKQAQQCCKDYLNNTIAKANPKLIIALGDTAISQLLNKHNYKITKIRGKLLNYTENCLLLPTFHPSYVLRGCHSEFPNISEDIMYSREKLFIRDFKLIKELIDNGFDKTKLKETIPLDTYSRIYDKSIRLVFDGKPLAFDVEWDGNELLCISLANIPDKAHVYIFEDKNKSLKVLNYLFSNPNSIRIVANRPVDELKLKEYGCEVKSKINDIFLMGHLVDENMTISLENLANTYVNMPYIKDIANGYRSNLKSAPIDTLIKYSGVDSDATFKIYQVLKKRLMSDKKLANYYVNFLQPISDLLIPLYEHGCRIDIPKLKENEEFFKNERDKLHEELLEHIPSVIKDKYADNLSINRPALLIDYLFTHPTGLRLKPKIITQRTKTPSTAENHLINFKDIEFVNKLLEYKKLTKILSTYITPMYEYIHNDGRVHPQTFLYRTVTGRTAMTNPPIQQIPQRGKYIDKVRELFVADDGWQIVATDLSQSEIRIMAWQAKEQRMLKTLKEGGDIHTLTATIITGKPAHEITKQERHSAKGVNFGFLYGMSAKSFVEYAKNDYGITLTQTEAELFREKFFSGYPAILTYHRQVKSYLTKHGFVYSPLGRIRRLPDINSPDKYLVGEAERKAINFGIQSFSSDLGLLGMYLFWESVKKDNNLKDKIKLLWFIHDAIFIQAKDEVVTQANELLKKCITVKTKEYIYKHFKLIVDYPIEVETKIGTNWANLKEESK